MACMNILRGLRAAAAVLLAAATVSPAVHAQALSDPYNYTRSSSFTYAANGLLASETVEPGNAQHCVTTSYGYDGYGNKNTSTTAGCTGATGLALIDARATGVDYEAKTVTVGGVSVTVPGGHFATKSTNALTQSETRTYDPRFGVPLTLTGPNTLTTSWQYDDFGRKTQELRADGTQTRTYYCTLTGSLNGVANNTTTNSTGCHNGPGAAAIPALAGNEAPADALRYEHSVSLSASGTPIGPFTRVYFDRAGRKLRTVTQGFDGTEQPGGTAQLIVQDVEYNAYGTAIVQTQPYFLGTSSSIAGSSVGYGLTLTEVDALGRTTALYTTDSQGSTSKVFGSRGSRTAAVLATAYAGLTTTTTDDKGRTRVEEKNPEGKVVRVTDALGAQLVHQHDAYGNLIVTKDALQNTTTIAYDLRGRKVSLTDPDAGVTTYCYDVLGQLKAQQTSNQRGSHTPSACPALTGTGTTAPVVAGWTTIAYDKLGRTTSRVEPEYTTTWTYDSCTKGVGKPCQVTTSHGLTRTFVYDSLGRPTDNKLAVTSGPSFANTLSYNADTGRVASQTYPTGVKVSYSYTARGFFEAVKLDTAVTVQPRPATPGGAAAAARTLAANTELWRAKSVDAWGNVQKHSYANGLQGWRDVEADTGRVKRIAAGVSDSAGVADQAYTWNSVGQVTSRVDALGDGASGIQVLDTFQYDAIGRLNSYQVSGSSTPMSRTVSLQYNALGMLLYKSDVGLYTYGAQATAGVRPHALQRVVGASNVDYGYDLNGNLVSATGGKYRSVAYTSFNLPDSQNGIGGPGGSPRYTWVYDENHQRLKEVRVNGQGTRTTWNLHPDNQGGLGFEREEAPGGNSNRHYLTAGSAVIGVLVTTGALPTLTGTAPPALASVTAVKLEYWHKDHLGSLVATTDHWGSVTARYAYDPFGKRRYTTSAYDANGNLVIDWTTDTNAGTDRGFTGHEHLDDVGLIHMNGRVFDPTLGRFMQPDPFIQDPLALQNYDRYAYCYNNPLTCTDPSGFKSVFSPGGFFTKLGDTGGDPLRYFAMRQIASNPIGYKLGTTVIAAFSTFCNGWAAACNAAGQTQWASWAGYSTEESIRIGAISGATAAAYEAVGTWTNAGTDQFAKGWNVAGHAVVGCASSAASGGSCRSGALSAGFPAAFGNYFEYSGNTWVAVAQSAAIGGIASVLGGGKFANGAVTGSFGYLFNFCMHNGCFDRRLTYSDAFAQGQLGNGSAITDVDPLTMKWENASIVYNGVTGTYTANFKGASSQEGLVFGNLPNITISATGVINIPSDQYDFDLKNPFTDPRGFRESMRRNILTAAGRIAQGPRYNPFWIHFRQGVQLPDDLRKQFESARK